MLRGSKLIIVNFTVLLDIDIRKPTIKSGDAYVIHFLFLAGLPVVFSLGNQAFHLPKAGHPVNFLVIWDDRTTANFKHCINLYT